MKYTTSAGDVFEGSVDEILALYHRLDLKALPPAPITLQPVREESQAEDRISKLVTLSYGKGVPLFMPSNPYKRILHVKRKEDKAPLCGFTTSGSEVESATRATDACKMCLKRVQKIPEPTMTPERQRIIQRAAESDKSLNLKSD